MKEIHFDWHPIITKKLMNFAANNIFDVKGVVISFFTGQKHCIQGQPFNLIGILKNTWSCPVTLTFKLKLVANWVIQSYEEAKKLVLPREFNIPMDPGEISIAYVPGYVCYDCRYF